MQADTSSPHPVFAAHFEAGMYEPDNEAIGDLAPFGGDLAADICAEWAERSGELERLTLRDMLEVDGGTGGMAAGDRDEITIAAGFVHLRATGWLDREGMATLRAAVIRCSRGRPDREFATLLQDLDSFKNEPHKLDRTALDRRWLRIRVGAGDGLLTQWCRQTEASMSAEAAWSDWWKRNRFTGLHFYPDLFGPAGPVRIGEEAQVLVVHAAAPQFVRMARRLHSGVITRDSPRTPSLMTLPNARSLLSDLLLSGIRTAADRKQLGTPPTQLPPS